MPGQIKKSSNLKDMSFVIVCDKKCCLLWKRTKQTYSSSSSSPPFNWALTSFHNLPLLWFSYQEVTAESKAPWKTKAPKKTVPTKTAFLLKKVLKIVAFRDCNKNNTHIPIPVIQKKKVLYSCGAMKSKKC